MFKKLFKYDFRSLKRIGLPVAFAILGAGVLGMLLAFVLRTVTEKTSVGLFDTLTIILSGLGFAGTFFLIPVAVVAVYALVYVNFYKSLVTDEGYLTFTLPVSAKDIIRSKFFNGMLWITLSAVMAVVAFALIVSPLFAGEIDFAILLEDLQWFYAGGGGIVVSGLLSILVALASLANSILLYFVAIFFGSVIANKHKILASLACILGVNMIYGTVTGIFSFIGELILIDVAVVGAEHFGLAQNIVSVLSFLALTGVNVLFYFLLKHMMERKINLA